MKYGVRMQILQDRLKKEFNKFPEIYEEEDFGIELDDETLTEQNGYVTTKQMVESMINAGERLNDARMLTEPDDDDDPYNPVEYGLSDPVDAAEKIAQNKYFYEQRKKDLESKNRELETKSPVPPAVAEIKKDDDVKI